MPLLICFRKSTEKRGRYFSNRLGRYWIKLNILLFQKYLTRTGTARSTSKNSSRAFPNSVSRETKTPSLGTWAYIQFEVNNVAILIVLISFNWYQLSVSVPT